MTQGHDIIVLHYPDVRPANWRLIDDAARRRNLELASWEPHRLQIYCDDNGAQVCYGGFPRPIPKAIMHRTVYPFLGVVVPALQLLADAGCHVPNRPEFAVRARDKLLTTIALAAAGLPIVPTLGVVQPGADALPMLPGGIRSEVITKPAHGVRGIGVRLHHTRAAAAAALTGNVAKRHRALPLEHSVAQPLIKPIGRDLRAYVVAGECLGLMQREAPVREFRANLSRGGRARPLPDDHPAAPLAVAALAACELDYGGVDLIEDADGAIRILEVDAWAGFSGLTAVTGADVAGALLDVVTQEVLVP
jgi:ribosomal protein S6--L-glutamate ligase